MIVKNNDRLNLSSELKWAGPCSEIGPRDRGSHGCQGGAGRAGGQGRGVSS